MLVKLDEIQTIDFIKGSFITYDRLKNDIKFDSVKSKVFVNLFEKFFLNMFKQS